jgi:hypothetical protein
LKRERKSKTSQREVDVVAQGTVAGFYHFPPVWVGAAASSSNGEVDLNELNDQIFNESFANGVQMRVSREGLFLYDFSSWPEAVMPSGDRPPAFEGIASVQLKRCAFMSSFLACLYTSLSSVQSTVIPKMAISPSDLVLAQTLDGPNMSSSDFRVMSLLMSRYVSTYPAGFPLQVDWRLGFRHTVIDRLTLEQGVAIFDEILAHGGGNHGLITISDIYTRACTYFEEHNYPLCLINAWAICEVLLQARWVSYVEANQDRAIDTSTARFISQERKRRLTSSRDYTASVILETLSLLDQIPFDLYKKLDKARSTRNGWIHELRPVRADDARATIEAAESLFSSDFGVVLHAPLLLSLSY